MNKIARFARTLSVLILPLPFVATQAQAQTDNEALGSGALISNTTGDYNTALGDYALRNNTTGSMNTATGRGAMRENVSGHSNTAMGVSALYFNTVGVQNVAIGESAMESNVDGESNVAVGYWAMYGSSEAIQSVAVGHSALGVNDAGVGNVAVGYSTLESNFSGSTNTGIGYFALCNSDGDSNTGVGVNALLFSTTGDQNTAVGGAAGVAVGCSACSNTGAFGYNATATASNTIRIGNTSITQIGGSVAWSNLSDGRFKTNVKQNVPGLEFITKLKPVTFNWKLEKLNEGDGAEEFASDPVLGEAREAKARKTYTGFIAQEVEEAARQCEFDFSGIVRPANEMSRYQLSYAEFVVPLVKAVQEQQKEIEELRSTVRALASDGRLPADRLGKGVGVPAQYAGIFGNTLGSLMAVASAVLLLLHLKSHARSRERAST